MIKMVMMTLMMAMVNDDDDKGADDYLRSKVYEHIHLWEG